MPILPISKSAVTIFSPAVILLCSVPPKQLKRWIFRYLPTVSPFLFNANEVLYDLPETLSMTEPQMIFASNFIAKFLKKLIVSPPFSSSGKFLNASCEIPVEKNSGRRMRSVLTPSSISDTLFKLYALSPHFG